MTSLYSSVMLHLWSLSLILKQSLQCEPLTDRKWVHAQVVEYPKPIPTRARLVDASTTGVSLNLD